MKALRASIASIAIAATGLMMELHESRTASEYSSSAQHIQHVLRLQRRYASKEWPMEKGSTCPRELSQYSIEAGTDDRAFLRNLVSTVLYFQGDCSAAWFLAGLTSAAKSEPDRPLGCHVRWNEKRGLRRIQGIAWSEHGHEWAGICFLEQ